MRRSPLPALPPGGVLLNARRGEIPGNPIVHPGELAALVRELCGADGYRIEGARLIALRWDDSGSEVIVDRFELQAIDA